MDPCELQQIDNYVDSILKNVNINKMLETLDMNEMDRYVEELLNKTIVIVEEYEVIEMKRKPTKVKYNTFRKNNTNQCIIS
jgi:hypothetical protein